MDSSTLNCVADIYNKTIGSELVSLSAESSEMESADNEIFKFVYGEYVNREEIELSNDEFDSIKDMFFVQLLLERKYCFFKYADESKFVYAKSSDPTWATLCGRLYRINIETKESRLAMS